MDSVSSKEYMCSLVVKIPNIFLKFDNQLAMQKLITQSISIKFTWRN